MFTRVREWIENRTGLIGSAQTFLGEEIPRSTGWRNTLGSVAGALLLVQILTGFLLALYYVPHLDAAYTSVEYIKSEMTAGGFVHAVHYWGASFIIVALFVHMLRVFFAGAYKKPRELNWLIGLLLFAIVIGLAFTGQLLPWGQEGYWAAKIGVEILSDVPLLGPSLAALFIGGEDLGALTLTRFYAFHVVLLPMLLGLLVGLHLYLLRRHGPLRTAQDTGTGTISFWPSQLSKDMIMASVSLVGLLIVGLLVRSPESAPADPTATGYIPRPEWYFLSHYELFRVTPGSMKRLTTFYLPAAVGSVLFLLPWLDRAKSTALAQRKLIVAGGAAAFVAVTGLTTYGLMTPPDQEAAMAAAQRTADEQADQIKKEQYAQLKAARSTFRKLGCPKCHTVNRRGGDVGPDLSGVGLRLQEAYLRKWIVNPTAFKPDTVMPAVNAPAEQIDLVVTYLQSLVREPEVRAPDSP